MSPNPSNPAARAPRLRDVRAYLRSPRFMERRAPLNAEGLVHLLLLLGATLLCIFILTPLMGAIVSGAMGDLPSNSLENIDMRTLFWLGVVIAPVWEELVYRSWLGGRRAVLIGLPLLAAVTALFATSGSGLGGGVVLILACVLGVLIAQLIIRVFRSSDSSLQGLRRRAFPLIFWGSALLFGMLHLGNYEGGLSHPVLLLAVLPQFFVGAVLGYVRMRFGLMAAMGFHASYNGVLIGLTMVVMDMVPETVEGAAVLLPLFG